jgi:cytochrome P450
VDGTAAVLFCCVGASFAMMEAVLLLATIATQFKLRVVEDHPVVSRPSFTLRPNYGIRMSLRSQESSVPRVALAHF